MLGRKNYAPDEIAAARTAVETQRKAYSVLTKTVASSPDAAKALTRFESSYFNSQLLALDRPFVHRLRMSTGKDTNALNEVELLVDSLLNNGGVFRTNSVIKYVPKDAVLGLEEGDRIELNAKQFKALSNRFFADLEARFV